MSTIRAKVEALIDRAVDGGATEEERRTSAVIAVRLIREHRLLGCVPQATVTRVPWPKHWPYPGSPDAREYHEPWSPPARSRVRVEHSEEPIEEPSTGEPQKG